MSSAQILSNQFTAKSEVHHGKCVCETCNCGKAFHYVGKHKCPDPIKKG
jgi:hypothetical protein